MDKLGPEEIEIFTLLLLASTLEMDISHQPTTKQHPSHQSQVVQQQGCNTNCIACLMDPI